MRFLGHRTDVAELLDRAERKIFAISGSKLRQGFVAMEDIVKDSFELVEQLYQQKRYVTGLETGFKDLDTMTSGFQNGEFIVIAGRPSMGKTTFAMNIAENAAIAEKLPVAVSSSPLNRKICISPFDKANGNKYNRFSRPYNRNIYF